MNQILPYSILLVLLSNGIKSETPHLNYRYSSFAVPNPNEAVEFLSKYNVIYVDNYNVQIVHILMQKLIAII